MKENVYNDAEDISFEELELIRTLSHLECLDDGICPSLDFLLNDDEN